MKYVSRANLPDAAKIVVIGEKYSKILEKPLKTRGIDVLSVPDNPNVGESVSGHADLSALHVGGKMIALAPYLKGSGFAESLSAMGFELSFPEITQGKRYPKDAALNVCLCGNKLIYNPKSAEKTIVEYLTNSGGYEALPVKQGYTKCSVCVVNESSIITSDEGIHKRAVETGMESLKVAPGFISLPGFDYGFIGGASFKLSKHELAFTGKLDGHPDKDKIIEFISLHNIEPVYITEKPAFDIGSCIQIVEKQQPEP